MPQSSQAGAPTPSTLHFYVTPRQLLSPGVLLLASVLALALLLTLRQILSHTRCTRSNAISSPGGATPAEDENEDLSTVETIYVGDPGEAPVPARPPRPGGPAGSVHPFVLVRLPRFGNQVGLIPDTSAGRLLYAWVAAFNAEDDVALARALPSAAPQATAAAQRVLRKRTGGFTVLSTQQVQPGLLVFRLRDQSALATEVLGSLEMVPNANPPAIASFSLRDIPQTTPSATPPAQ